MITITRILALVTFILSFFETHYFDYRHSNFLFINVIKGVQWNESSLIHTIGYILLIASIGQLVYVVWPNKKWSLWVYAICLLLNSMYALYLINYWIGIPDSVISKFPRMSFDLIALGLLNTSIIYNLKINKVKAQIKD